MSEPETSPEHSHPRLAPEGNVRPSKTSVDDASAARPEASPWKVLVVDDDVSIHKLTRNLLADLTFDGIPLRLFDGYSGADARQLLTEHPDAAILLLDVVMESELEGLSVVRFVREEMQNPLVRIILRTGQSAMAPEHDVVLQYDINDYIDKSDFKAHKFLSAVITGLRGYRDLKRIEHLASSNELLEQRVRERTEALKETNFALNQKNQELEKEIRERQSLEEKKERIHESTLIIGQLLRMALEPLTLLEQLHQALELVLSIPWLSLKAQGGIFLVDRKNGEYFLVVQKDLPDGPLRKCARIQQGECLCGLAAKTRKIVFSDSLDHRHGTCYEGMQEHGHYCVPILHQGKALGILNLYLKAGHRHDAEEEIFLSHVASTLANIVDRARTGAERDRLVAILESTSDLVCMVGPDLGLVYLNRAGRHMLRWPSGGGDISGKTLADLHTGWAWESVRAQGLPTARNEGVWTGETALMDALGGEVPVSQVIVAHRGTHGEVEFFSGVMRDISLRKTAEKEIRTMNLELERRIRERTSALELANKELESFAYTVSHDLRAPLRSIGGFSDILLEDYGDRLDADGQEYLTNLRQSCKEMNALIDGLLRLSRSTQGDVLRQGIDLSALSEEILTQLGRSTPQRPVTWRVMPGMRVFGDLRLIKTALENLLNNAWKYTSKSPRAVIEIAFRHEGREIVYSIRDNGVGFDMAHAAKLFHPFQRLHKSRDFEGIGIGLATVQRIINRHGGRIWVEAAIGQGATFHFTLPGGEK
ncbi:MAG: GAF domain-containing protein [Magnetococcales bacterium]|nr:GAF domain-containing protein [Magnetococcales bacterium]